MIQRTGPLREHFHDTSRRHDRSQRRVAAGDSFSENLDVRNDGLRLQREFFLELSQTEDHQEALRAFREKRTPDFRNR